MTGAAPARAPGAVGLSNGRQGTGYYMIVETGAPRAFIASHPDRGP